MAHPSHARFTRSLEIYLSIGLKATSLGRAKIHELLDLLSGEGGGVSAKTSQTVFRMGEPRIPRRLAYVMHDEGMRDRAAELEVTARRETRALVSLQEIVEFSALVGFEGRGNKSSITHTYQTLATFMRLPSASGREVLGAGRSKFTHEASPAVLPGKCPAHFARDGVPAVWDRVNRILWDALRATLAMQLQSAHI
eukprot:1406199-Pleurochrysis_carterae.AAC.2